MRKQQVSSGSGNQGFVNSVCAHLVPLGLKMTPGKGWPSRSSFTQPWRTRRVPGAQQHAPQS